MTDVKLSVPEIHCDHCKSSIESAVGEIPGVAGVAVTVGERSVAVDYDGEERTYTGIVQAIQDQGYSVAT